MPNNLTTQKPYLGGWREEMTAVEQALEDVLPRVGRPILSVPLGTLLVPVVGLSEARIRKILGWIAQAGHSHVTHDGPKVRVYGRDAVLWRWHPEPQKVPMLSGGLGARLNEAGVVDTSEW